MYRAERYRWFLTFLSLRADACHLYYYLKEGLTKDSESLKVAAPPLPCARVIM